MKLLCTLKGSSFSAHRFASYLCGILLVAPASLFAQAISGSATVGGTVTDDTGAVISRAAVSLVDVARGLKRETLTNNVGRYLFPNVPAGAYTLRVTQDGFDAYEITRLNVEVGQLATLDVELKVGQVSTVVTVSGEQRILLETESNTIGTVVDSARVDALPLNGRNFLQLALLAAGSNEPVGRSDVAGQTGLPGRAVSIAGNMGAATGYLINGIAVRGERLGELAVNLSVADIDQFKVQQSFFMPDQGPNPGLVNVTTRGGGNTVHGQVFHFLRNTRLDARNFFAPDAEELKRNQFGFAVGGPIQRDRMWFHIHYEGMRDITAFSARAYAPTQSMFGGNFQQVPEIIHDPLTFSESTGPRLPFPNQVIPDDRINPVSRALLNYYIAGSSLELRPQNVFANPRNTLNDDQWSVRLDRAISDHQNIFGQFVHQNAPAVHPGIFPLSGAFYPNQMQLAMAQHNWTLRPNVVNTLRVGFTRNVALFSNEGRDRGPILDEIGIRNTFDNRGVTSIGFQEFSGFGRANGDLGNLDNNYQVDEGINWVRGRHNFQFGSSVRYRRTWQQNANAAAHGNLGFQRTFTAQVVRNPQGQLAPTPGTGNSFADFLLGMNTTGAYRGLPMLPYRYTQFMPYFQDTWKVTRSLTVNYGISWFYATVPNPQGFARQMPHGFDETTGLLTFAALDQIDPRVVSLDRNNLTPRLGFAWQPSFLPNTVVRGGAGVYYSDTRLIELQFAMVGPPFNDSIDAFNSPSQPFPTWVLGQNLFPAPVRPPLDQHFAATIQGDAPFLINEHGRSPYIQQWNFSVQHTLANDNLIELVYMGSGGHALQNRYDYNQCRVGADLRCDNATRPWPRYTSLLRADFNGNSSYNAFLAKYHHRTSHGLNLRLEYIWAKALNDTWEGAASTNAQITTCRSCDKGHASFDVRHRAVISTLYDVPFGRGRRLGAGSHPIANALLGDWTLTAITTFQTGVPFLITNQNRTGSAFVAHLPNRVCNGANRDLARSLRTGTMQYFDTQCFEIPPVGFFGNSGRNILHGPGVNNWDVGVQKFFPIQAREDMRLQFRAEMFNAFNHAQFNNPNASVPSPNFGLVGGARAPRLIQFALKLLF